MVTAPETYVDLVLRGADRFWAKVDKTETCWLWTGAKARGGYGQVRRRGRGINKLFYAHRYALILAGIDPGPKLVDHICHNPPCVRPDHLRLATQKQNQENKLGPRSDNSSGVLGVYRDAARSRWSAKVGHNGRYYSTRFDDFDEACAWVIAKRNELFTHNDADRSAA